MRSIRLTIVALAFAVSFSPAWAADENAEADQREKEEQEGPELLPVPMQVEFKLVPEEPDQKPMSVVVALEEYAMELKVKTQVFRFEFGVKGELHHIENTRKFLVTFKSIMAFKNDDVDSRVEVEGSSVVSLGKETRVAQLGEKDLHVIITPAAQTAAKKREVPKKDDKAGDRDDEF